VDSSTGQPYSQRGNQVYLQVFAKPHVSYTCFNSMHPECFPENELTPRLHFPMQKRLIENAMELAALCDAVQFSRQAQRLRLRPQAPVFRTCSNIVVGSFRHRTLIIFRNIPSCGLKKSCVTRAAVLLGRRKLFNPLTF
jgi:hypothetical protein